MAHFVDTLKKPIVWVYFSVIYIWLLSVSVLVATLGPPIVLSLLVHPKDSSSLSYLVESFPLYAQTASKELNISAGSFMFSFFSNIILFSIAVYIGFFVLRKSLWARNALIFLILLLILQPIIISVIEGASFYDFLAFEAIIELIFLSLIVYILTRQSVKKIFARKIIT